MEIAGCEILGRVEQSFFGLFIVMDGPAEQRCRLPQVDKMTAVQQHCRAAAGFRSLQVFVDHLHTQSENIVGAVGNCVIFQNGSGVNFAEQRQLRGVAVPEGLGAVDEEALYQNTGALHLIKPAQSAVLL